MSVKAEEEESITFVLPADDMSDENFMRHMNMRHKDSIGGLHSLWLIHPDVTGSWRSFHDRLHRAGFCSHSHREPETDA